LNKKFIPQSIFVSSIHEYLVSAPRLYSSLFAAELKNYISSFFSLQSLPFLRQELEERTKKKDKSWFQDICVTDRSRENRGWRDHRAKCLLLMRIVPGATLGMGRC
jgi:hypothetical protein